MENMKLSPPWYTYANEVKALFGGDPDVKVVFDADSMTLRLYVDDDSKADAIGRLLPTEKTFGNAKLSIFIVPANAEGKNGQIDDIRKAFDGNSALSFIYDADTPFGEMHYVVFRPEVVQFYNDDMGDINGNRTMLMQDVAREVLGEELGVYICSDAINIEQSKPLGEWP